MGITAKAFEGRDLLDRFRFFQLLKNRLYKSKKTIDKLLFYSYYRNIKPVRGNEREEKWGYFGERRNSGNKSAVSFWLSFDVKKWLG